jgi:hypothetical protein
MVWCAVVCVACGVALFLRRRWRLAQVSSRTSSLSSRAVDAHAAGAGWDPVTTEQRTTSS